MFWHIIFSIAGMSLSVVKINEEPLLPVLRISHSVIHPENDEVPVTEKEKEENISNGLPKPLMPPQEQGYLKYNRYDFF